MVDKLKVDHWLSIYQYNGQLIKMISYEIYDLINVEFTKNWTNSKSIVKPLEIRLKPGSSK